MKQFFYYASFIMMLVAGLMMTSCNDDESDFVQDTVCGIYEYHLSGIVAVGDEQYEFPVEIGTMQIYKSGEKEWNLKVLFTSIDGNCYIADGSCENEDLISIDHSKTNFTVADETFNTFISGQGRFDKKGNIEVIVSLYGMGIKKQDKLVNDYVRLIAIRK